MPETPIFDSVVSDLTDETFDPITAMTRDKWTVEDAEERIAQSKAAKKAPAAKKTAAPKPRRPRS